VSAQSFRVGDAVRVLHPGAGLGIVEYIDEQSGAFRPILVRPEAGDAQWWASHELRNITGLADD
jgi:hypothetical protein